MDVISSESLFLRPSKEKPNCGEKRGRRGESAQQRREKKSRSLQPRSCVPLPCLAFALPLSPTNAVCCCRRRNKRSSLPALLPAAASRIIIVVTTATTEIGRAHV